MEKIQRQATYSKCSFFFLFSLFYYYFYIYLSLFYIFFFFFFHKFPIKSISLSLSPFPFPFTHPLQPPHLVKPQCHVFHSLLLSISLSTVTKPSFSLFISIHIKYYLIELKYHASCRQHFRDMICAVCRVSTPGGRV